MRLVRFLPAVLALAVSSCGDRDPQPRPPDPPATPAAPASPAVDTRPAIVMFGDSITAGHGVEPGHAFPEVVQRELDARGLRYRVVNAGVSGDTTSNGLDRLPSVLALKPEMIFIELGGNDGLRGLPVASTKANLEEMIATSQKAGVKVLLAGMTLPLNYGAAYIRDFEKMYEDLARGYKVRILPLRLETIGGPEGMQRDGIHPNRDGQRRLGEFIAKAMFP